jgi:ribonuclease P protein subunit RPR2
VCLAIVRPALDASKGNCPVKMPQDNTHGNAQDRPPKTAKTPKTTTVTSTPKVKGVPNKHLHARTTFLYQAATYLTLQAAIDTQEHSKEKTEAANQALTGGSVHVRPQSALALQLGSHLRAVSLKGQVRLSTDLKRTLCKTCNTILIPGQTSTQTVENESKGERKPHADVLVVECNFCKSKKRFPIGVARQQKKAKRASNKKASSPDTMSVDVEQSATPALRTGTDQSASSS